MVANIDIRSSEEETLDKAVTSIDPILRASLQRDQKRRRTKIAMWGILMAMLCVVAVLFVVFSGVLPSDVDAAPPTEVNMQIARMEKAADLAAEGWDLFREKKRRDSAAKFKEALLIDPKSEDAWCGLGWSLFNTRKLTDSAAAFEECLKISPENSSALSGVGQVKFVQRKYDEAETYLLDAANSGASSVWSSLTVSYLLQGKYDQAGVWFEHLKHQVERMSGWKESKKQLPSAK